MPIETIIQNDVIDVSGWTPDGQYYLYPEGARPKKAYFPPTNCGENYIKKDRRYLFKKSSHAPSDQFWAEIVAYKIGSMLGVQVPPSYAAFNSVTGESGALVEWFYKDGECRFIHGAEYMKRVIYDYNLDTGEQHNLSTILKICRTLSIKSKVPENAYIFKTDYITYWGEVILFDALIGNSDRHQHNWGITVIKREKLELELSPLFDNGTSLGSDRFIRKLKSWPDTQFDKYINNGTHHMKLAQNSVSRANHIQLLYDYIQIYPQVKQHLYDMIQGFSLASLAKQLANLKNLNIPEKLSCERVGYYLKLTAKRRSNILDVLK